MAVIMNIPFLSETLNTSLQVGDNIYYTLQGDIHKDGGFQTTNNSMTLQYTPIFLGEIIDITQLPASINAPTSMVTVLDREGPRVIFQNNLTLEHIYFSFSKSGVVNQNELIGYYASIKFENNSTEKAELFSAGTEVHENSK